LKHDFDPWGLSPHPQQRRRAHAETSLRDKLRLWELPDEQTAQAEEEAWEQDPTVEAEIREARAAYQAGDYVTIDEYIAQWRGKA
jgi:hypothetical protein